MDTFHFGKTVRFVFTLQERIGVIFDKNLGMGYTLSLDLGGPYLKGKDLYQDQRHVLIGTYQFPILDKPEVEDGYSIPEFCAEGPVDDDVVLDSPGECASETEEVPEFEIRKVMESKQAWKKLKDHATTPVRMVNFMMAEPIASKQKSDVLSAVQRMTIKLQRHGYPLLRIHSDRGGEFVNKGFRAFCEARQIYRTTGDPGSPQTNGRSEATVGVFKRGVRALLKQAGLEPQYWARAAVQWAALRWKWAEQQLGLQPDAILPFGAKVQVRRRPWELRGADGTKRGSQWLDRTQPALLLGPCDEVPGGYLVEAKGSKDDPDAMVLFPTTVLYDKVQQPAQPLECDVEMGESDPRPTPTRRLRSKCRAHKAQAVGELDNDDAGHH